MHSDPGGPGPESSLDAGDSTPAGAGNGSGRSGGPGPGAEGVEEFLRLFGTHRRRLYQFILSLVSNLQDAEDVLQETNIILWRKFADYQPGTNFYAWAARVAHFEVLKLRRKLSREAVLLDDAVLEQVAADARDGADSLEAVRDALQKCLQKLSPADRELIARRYGTGSRGKAVAEQLGRPANSVYKSLGRIRQALLECINRGLRLADRPGGAL